MRPALDRLLSRPFSLDLLRYLISTTLESSSTATNYRRASKRRVNDRRHYHATCAAVKYGTTYKNWGPSSELSIDGVKLASKQTAKESIPETRCDQATNSVLIETIDDNYLHVRKPLSNGRKAVKGPFFFKLVLQGKTPIRDWTFDEIQFESALEQPNYSGKKRLVDQVEYKANLDLWAQLLAHRRRIFGLEGVRVIWDKMREKKIQIPYEGRLSTLFWHSFIDLGLRKRKVLNEIICYTDENEQCSRLPMLYIRVIQHYALEGNQSDVTYWHHRLTSKHPPSAQKFRQMVRTIVYSKGDMNILKYLYEASEHRNAYSNVVPVLCTQERFEEALKWHHILISHFDLPVNAKDVEMLQSYLEEYHPKKAMRFLQSLSDAGVSFMPPETIPFALSREMMNRYHGEAYGIKEKPYSDKLGARWFATRWISLELAIHSVHALGFLEIGPLSLQSIALREQDASKITERIIQLKKSGISIGSSVYVKAIETFARQNQHSLLKSLLESDQHPDAFEDWKLQESLLGEYAAAGEWKQYARTIAIRRLGSPQSKTQEYNILIRDFLTREEPSLKSILQLLEEMRIRGLQVKPMTSRYLVARLLRPRRGAHRPVFLPNNPRDLEILLTILHNLLKSGSYVPGSVWIEIMKRLGMSGRLKELETLCLSLADWYHPHSTIRKKNVYFHCQKSPDLGKFQIPAEIESSHPKHPFSILFPSSLQSSIVEFGFISYFRQFRVPLNTKNESSIHPSAPIPSNYPIGKHPCTQGIRFIHLLRDQGVYIYRKAIRMAIITRLLAYYGTGTSKRWHNRIASKLNPFTFHEFVEEVEAAWNMGSGKKRLFSKEEVANLRQRIDNLGSTRVERVERNRLRRVQRWKDRKAEREKGLRTFNDGELVIFSLKR